MTALILGCGSSNPGTTMGADDANSSTPNTRVRQDAAGATDLGTPIDPMGTGGAGGSVPGASDAAQLDVPGGGSGGSNGSGSGGNHGGGGNSGGQGGMLGAGGTAQGGSSGSGGTGGITPRPDASTFDTTPIDGGGTRPDAVVAYPYCKDIDLLASTTPCSRPGEVRKIEWARKDGYRCAVCSSSRGIGEQQAGCLRQAPSSDPEPQLGPYLCVLVCKECAY